MTQSGRLQFTMRFLRQAEFKHKTWKIVGLPMQNMSVIVWFIIPTRVEHAYNGLKPPAKSKWAKEPTKIGVFAT
jgi:hypothetical protein